MKGLSEILLRRQVHTMYQHCMLRAELIFCLFLVKVLFCNFPSDIRSSGKNIVQALRITSRLIWTEIFYQKSNYTSKVDPYFFVCVTSNHNDVLCQKGRMHKNIYVVYNVCYKDSICIHADSCTTTHWISLPIATYQTYFINICRKYIPIII